jgi:hypothetical protein
MLIANLKRNPGPFVQRIARNKLSPIQHRKIENSGDDGNRIKKGEDKKDREKGSELALLVVRAFQVVEVLEGDLLEDGVDGLRVEALADVFPGGMAIIHSRQRNSRLIS